MISMISAGFQPKPGIIFQSELLVTQFCKNTINTLTRAANIIVWIIIIYPSSFTFAILSFSLPSSPGFKGLALHQLISTELVQTNKFTSYVCGCFQPIAE